MISNYGSLSCACPHNERQLPQKDQDAKNPTEQTIWSSWHNQKRNSRRHREPTLCQASADRSSSCSRPASGSGAWIWTSIPETCYLQNSWNCDTMCFWKSWYTRKNLTQMLQVCGLPSNSKCNLMSDHSKSQKRCWLWVTSSHSHDTSVRAMTSTKKCMTLGNFVVLLGTAT